MVCASLYAYEGRCDHVTATAFKAALNDIETGLRCHLQKSSFEYLRLYPGFVYAPDRYTLIKPSDLKIVDPYIDLLLQPRCNGQPHYEFYLEVMEAYAERRSNDPSPLLPLGCLGGRVDIALYDTLQRVRSYVNDWICELQWQEKDEQACDARRRDAEAMKALMIKRRAGQQKRRKAGRMGTFHADVFPTYWHGSVSGLPTFS